MRLLEDKAISSACSHFSTFIQLVKEDYDMQWFHKYTAERLDAFVRGEIKNLMILMPVQHGKSEIASRLFPAYLLGRRPSAKVGLVTYNDTFAKKFNRQIQRNIQKPIYSRIFPNTNLQGSKLVDAEFDNYSKNANEFEIINTGGSMATVGRGGQINGLTLDVLIMDDMYKNRDEAISPTISEGIWQTYTEVLKTRLHNKSQQLMMNTRWDERDIAGRLLATEPDNWEVIKFAAIRTKDECKYDPRKEGEALYPQKHSLERLLSVKNTSQITFNSLYQQDPKPNTELLIFNDWQECDIFPPTIEKVFWGIDWGFTNDPTVVVRCGFIGNDLYLDECFYQTGKIASDGKKAIWTDVIVKVLKDNGYHQQAVFCDHITTEIAGLRAKGVLAMPAMKGEGSINAGIDKVTSYNIFITKKSVNGKREANNYQWETLGEIITNTPLENGHDHFWDAARMAVYTATIRRG